MGLVPRGPSGACVYLTDEGDCGVYDERPLECNVKRMAKTMKVTEKEYYKEVSKTCNKLMDDYGVDKSYKLDLKIYDD